MLYNRGGCLAYNLVPITAPVCRLGLELGSLSAHTISSPLRPLPTPSCRMLCPRTCRGDSGMPNNSEAGGQEQRGFDSGHPPYAPMRAPLAQPIQEQPLAFPPAITAGPHINNPCSHLRPPLPPPGHVHVLLEPLELPLAVQHLHGRPGDGAEVTPLPVLEAAGELRGEAEEEGDGSQVRAMMAHG